MNLSILNFRNGTIKQRSTINISYDLVSLFLIVTSVIFAFYPAFNNDFLHWDDQYYVTNNIYITQPNWEHLQVLLSKVISLNYHPLTMISLWANSYFFGVESATSFIITNVIIHSITAYCIYKVVLLLTHNQYLTAFFTALLFAIHPMHVESVVWVSERKDVLYGFFFFASLWSWLIYKFDRNKIYYFAALILFVLSCLSKAMAVSLVPVIFLIDIYQKNSWQHYKFWLEKIPFIAIAIIFGSIAISVQKGGDFYGLLSNTNIDSAVISSEYISTYDKVINIGYGLYYYIRSFLMPIDMSAFHPYMALTEHSLKEIFFFTPFLLLALWMVSFHYHKRIFLGLGFFIITVALVLQWIPVGSAIVADRYTYLPYVGLALIGGSTIQYIYNHRSQWLAYFLMIICSLPLIASTHQQSDVWQDHSTLFSQSVERYPEDAKSRMLLATGLWTSGSHREAIHHIEYAINELGLITSDAFEQLANCYDEIGERDKAIAFYNHSITLDPQNYVARYHRGIAIMNIDPELAIEDFNMAESSGFEYIKNNIYGPRGVCYGMIGQYEKAILDLTTAINLWPNHPENYRDRAITYEHMGQYEKAEQDRKMMTTLE